VGAAGDPFHRIRAQYGRYLSVRESDDQLRTRLRALAAERPRWGYRRLHVLLRREGWAVNHKRVQRLYREEGLAVRCRRKRRRSSVARLVREPMGAANERWSLDVVSDALQGRVKVPLSYGGR